MLHKDGHSVRSFAALPESKGSPNPQDENIPSNCTFSAQSVLLATAQVTLKNIVGDPITVSALIDPGSMRSFVSKRIATAFKVEFTLIDVGIKGVGDTSTAVTKEYCHLTLSSPRDKDLSLDMSALILGQLTLQPPQKKLRVTQYPYLKGLKLADPEYMNSKRIDCILGADAYPNILLEGIRTGPAGTPMAQNLRLGWILTGVTCAQDRDCLEIVSKLTVNSFHVQQEYRISAALVKMWEIEKILSRVHLTEEKSTCEEHFVQTKFKVNDRFGVHLPFKSRPSFPVSKEIAIKSGNRLKSRLAKNEDLKRSYD